MQERNLKVIEGLLFVLFILLWGLFLSGGSGKVKRRTLSLWQYIPVHTEVFHDFFENSIRKGQYELTANSWILIHTRGEREWSFLFF